jgi:hypothetical protein
MGVAINHYLKNLISDLISAGLYHSIRSSSLHYYQLFTSSGYHFCPFPLIKRIHSACFFRIVTYERSSIGYWLLLQRLRLALTLFHLAEKTIAEGKQQVTSLIIIGIAFLFLINFSPTLISSLLRFNPIALISA